MKEFSQAKKIARIILVLFLASLIAASAGHRQQVLRTERDYQRAFNEVYFRGRAQMEVPVKHGRIDLLTSEYAVEVDTPGNFHEAIGQALHYARETGKKPAVAFYIADHEPGEREKLKYAMWLCETYHIKTWFINDELKKARRK